MKDGNKHYRVKLDYQYCSPDLYYKVRRRHIEQQNHNIIEKDTTSFRQKKGRGEKQVNIKGTKHIPLLFESITRYGNVGRITSNTTSNRHGTVRKGASKHLESMFTLHFDSHRIYHIRSSRVSRSAKLIPSTPPQVVNFLLSPFVRRARNDCRNHVDSRAFHVGCMCCNIIFRCGCDGFHFIDRKGDTSTTMGRHSYYNSMDIVMDVADWNRTHVARKKSAQPHYGFGILVGRDAIRSHGVEDVSIINMYFVKADKPNIIHTHTKIIFHGRDFFYTTPRS